MMIATIALQSVGMLVGAAVALATLRLFGGDADWQPILGATGVGGCLFLLSRLWLFRRPALADAAWPRPGSGESSPSSPPPLRRIASAQAVQTEQGGLSLLVSRPYRARTALVSVPWFLMDIATYGVGLFARRSFSGRSIFLRPKQGRSPPIRQCAGSAAIDLVLLFGFLIGLSAVPRFGRVHMQVTGFVGMTLGMLVLLFAVTAGAASSMHLVSCSRASSCSTGDDAGPNATTSRWRRIVSDRHPCLGFGPCRRRRQGRRYARHLCFAAGEGICRRRRCTRADGGGEFARRDRHRMVYGGYRRAGEKVEGWKSSSRSIG